MNNNAIEDNSIYKEETLKERARLDERERREKAKEQKRKQDDSNNFLRNAILGILFALFIYFMLLKPLYEMFV